MALSKITTSDLTGKGVIGQEDIPGLTAAQMQAKVEEIVRDVVIPKFNSNVDVLTSDFATQDDLEEVVVAAGAITSVFGRVGNVKAQSGDYTAAQVGAAASTHASQHATGGDDEIEPADIGAAAASHTHGNITNDGKISGVTSNGKLLITGVGGLITTIDMADITEFVHKATNITATGAVSVTVQNNYEYDYTDVTSLTMVGASVNCHGRIAFASSTPTIAVSGFTKSDGDDITDAAASETWEFDVDNGYIIWKNWGT